MLNTLFIILPYIHFICILVCAFMAAFVFFKNTKSLLNILYSLLMLCFLIWNFSDIFAHNPHISVPREHVLFLLNISAVGWISFASILLCFSLVFIEKTRILKNRLFSLLLFLIPSFFLYQQWTGSLLAHPVKQPYGWSFTWGASWLSYLFFFYFLFFSVLSVLIIFFYGGKTANIRKKKQSGIITLTIILSVIGGTLFDVVSPLLGLYNIPSIGDIFVLVLTVGTAYGIFKYKFLTITPHAAADKIISTMDEYLILLDNRGSVLSVNEAFLEALGYLKSEIIGKPLGTMMREDANEYFMFDGTAHRNTVKNREGILVKKDGKEIPVLFSCSPLNDEEGVFAGTVLVATEISELMLFEKELYDLNKKITLLAEATSEFNSAESIEDICGIIIKYSLEMDFQYPLLFRQREGLFLLANIGDDFSGRLAQYGITPADLIDCWAVEAGSDINLIARAGREGEMTEIQDAAGLITGTPLNTLPYVKDTVLQLLRPGTLMILSIPGCGLLCLSAREGKKEQMEIWIRAILVQASTALGREKAKNEKEETYKQLIHIEKMAGIGTLAAGVAHEFNNMLQIMKSSVEYSEMSGKTEDYRESNTTVKETINRAAHIVVNLLSFSGHRSEGEKPDLLTECMDNVLVLTEAQLRKKNIKVVKDYGPIQPVVFDRVDIQQVFLNLIINARDAMIQTGGTIEIRFFQKENRVIAQISDTGIGIRKEHLSKIFVPFHTTKGALGKGGLLSGTGLGLYVSYNIIKKYGGSITVESPRSDGSPGTTFTVSLPVSPEAG